MNIIKTSIEQYVEQHGVIGTIALLDKRINSPTPYLLKEFFKTVRLVIITDMGKKGRIFEAAKHHHDLM